MDPSYMGLWVVVITISILVAYAGMEETLKLFAYLDLQLRYAWIQFRMKLMARKLRKELGLPPRVKPKNLSDD